MSIGKIETVAAELVALRLDCVRQQDEGEGATAERADASLGDGHHIT
jgi:hypothetical protein